MASDGPGFRFHPTDEELVSFYLRRKVSGRVFRLDPIGVVEIYKFEPYDLPSMAKLPTRDLEWYFFTILDKKYRNGSSSRTNRATYRGYWKTTGNDRPVKRGDRDVGMKKTLVYHEGRAPHGTRTNWVMHEYRMTHEELSRLGAAQDAYVVCRIFKKSGSGPKNGEKYGAPLIEEDWERDDHVFLFPTVYHQVDPPLPAVDDEVAPFPAAAGNEPSNEGSASAGSGYVEVADLDEELDVPPNLHYGECSSHPGHSLIDVLKPSDGTFGIPGLQNDQGYNMPELYGVDTNYMEDGDYGEASHNENPLNFNCAIDGPDLYLDATGYPPIPADVPYMEANDLVNWDEGNPTVKDPFVTEMLDEYLAFSDEDIFNYISFDSPQNSGSESLVANHEQPSIEQNVEGETNGSSLANEHIFEAQSSNEASSKQNSEASNLISGDTNPFVKQANKLLASIPAAPAFASEFPTKEFTLGLHAAQSSNSAHVTTGMISITDITFRGNAMDWMVGKNGGFNAIVSTGFPQPDANSAALVPISGMICSKTAFVLSHGWIFLMGFSVLILSLSFKIGSFMHAGK